MNKVNIVKNFKNFNEQSVNISVFGNSIAAGYSMVDEIKPLGYIIDSLVGDYIRESKIDFKTYDLAQAADNSDKHTLNFFLEDITLSEMKKNIHSVYFKNGKMDAPVNISEENFEKFYHNLEEDKKISEVIKTTDSNIIIYSGATGKSLDEITRKGRVTPAKLKKCFTDELSYIQAFMNNINNQNRKNEKIQVYILGIPNFFGINAVSYFNKFLKEIASLHPCTTFVEPSKIACLYNRDKKIFFDFHYDNEERDKNTKKILASIEQNYEDVHLSTALDKKLFRLSQENRKSDKEIYDKKTIISIMDETIRNEKKLSDEEIIKFLKNFKKYFSSIYPSDFYYIDKEIINDYEKKLK